MEANVQRLLQAEQEVNQQVQQALKNKRERLGKIQAQVELEVAQYKKELEEDKKQQI